MTHFADPIRKVMTHSEQEVSDEALRFARSNKKMIARRLTDKAIYPPEEAPVSVYMAGSPGAGKTEASIALVNLFADTPILRIDPDEPRSEFVAYTGGNSWLFQRGVSILVEKILDLAMDQQQSFLLDGTFSNIDVARRNVDRSLRKGRFVQILYVYQDPMLAWDFVKAREEAEGRRIRKEHFIDQYFAARDVVNALKLEYGGDIHVDLLLKHIDNSGRLYEAGVEKIDYHIPERHTRADLEARLGQPSGA
ncbi:zeta toxin family protein [Pseudomonas sp. CBSPBW29]|uniref:zeta toxin family protein n=1 Tax=Pseudomonas TaxID=286 RepID=UPI0021AD0C44|nr:MULTISPECIES: zeta toxin family protein [unclassified Pseudomonas]WEL41661.1 zeta toxin family protein [Pseudomonas sp. CBSPBW29]WEL62722.1 zeta toxin family protein [Pseudomonas sp. CBSPGW29]WEL71908.1 zeta toxin family protein [Pseudomonas sp. CBSPCGW29]WEL82539.1 zeta toxin family protein [Pseudomonas sp. CBSPCAW29]WEL91014.1 zeta toxin family protein [Pseudomonas sp. CBSPCBW29]